MANEHIELVKKWLADKDSVSPAELADNVEATWAAYDNAMAAVDAAYFAAFDLPSIFSCFGNYWSHWYWYWFEC